MYASFHVQLSLLHQEHMKFAAVSVTPCQTPETCEDLDVGGISVRTNKDKEANTIICLRLRKRHRPSHSAPGMGASQFESKLITGSSLNEKMEHLERFAMKNQYSKVFYSNTDVEEWLEETDEL